MIAERIVERVPMVDGVELETVVFLPGGAGPFAAELLRTPYGVDDRVDDAERMTADGVAVVVQSCRGRFGSGGHFDLGATDGTDGAATVRWMRAQPWSDGRVALWGFSYGGFTQWATVLAGATGLTSICPSMCPPPGRHLDFRHHGAIEWAALAHWLPRQAAIGSPGDSAASRQLLAWAFEPESVLDDDGQVDVGAALSHPSLGRHPMVDAWPVAGTGDYEMAWRAVFTRPPVGFDIQIGPLSGTNRVSKPGGFPDDALDDAPDDVIVDAPALVVGSYYDLWSEEPGLTFEWLRTHSASAEVAAAHRLVLAASGHGFHPLEGIDTGPDATRFGLDLDHQWALEWLRGVAGPLRNLAPVTWFLLGPNEWRSAQSWPPEGAVAEQLTVVGAGDGDSDATTIVVDPADPVPTRGGSGMLLPPGPWDQRGLSSAHRPDIASFTFPPVAQTTVLAGPVHARLWVSVDAPDADVAAKLVDVAPDGRAMSVCDGITRLRWRDGTEAPALLEPGTPVVAEIRMGAVGYQVEAGHHLRLDVAGTNFPRYALNAHTGAPDGTDDADDLRAARLTIHHGPALASTLTVTVLPGASP